MAKKDRAACTLTTSVLPRSIRTGFSGSNSFIPLSNSYKWVYSTITVTSSVADIFTTSMTYVGTSTNLSATDKILWLGIKHTGTLDGSSKTSDGILIGLDNNDSLAYDSNDAMFIDSKDMYVSKFANTTVGDLTARSIAVLSHRPVNPSTIASGNVRINVAAIIQDVG